MGISSFFAKKPNVASTQPRQQFKPVVMWNGQVGLVPVSRGPSRAEMDKLEAKKTFRSNLEKEWASDRHLQQHVINSGAQYLYLDRPHQLLKTDVVELPTISSPRRIPQGSLEQGDFDWLKAHLSNLGPSGLLSSMYNDITQAGVKASGAAKGNVENAKLALRQAADQKMFEINKMLVENNIFIQLHSEHYEPDQDGDKSYMLHISFPTTTLEANHWRDQLFPQLRQQHGIDG